MITELFIEGQRADMSKEISALLTYQIDDIKDFGGRHTNFSKTIVLPGTGRNNKLLGHIYDVKSSNQHNAALPNINYNFNAAKGAECQLFQGNIQCFKGVMRLTEIIKDGELVEYEVVLFGELGGFVSAIGSSKLEDLDFSAYDVTYSIANIVNSWNNPGGSGVYFPLMDYGNYSDSTKHNWKYRTFRPALYGKEYIDKIFSAAKFTYDCPLFNTARFKGLVVPHNTKVLQRKSTTYLDVEANHSNLFTSYQGGPGVTETIYLPIHHILGNFVDLGNGTYQYNGPTITTDVNITVDINYENPNDTEFIYFNKNTAGSTIGSINLPQTNNGVTPITTTVKTTAVTFNNGDTIFVTVGCVNASIDWQLNIQINKLGITLGGSGFDFVPINLGEQITINDTIPKNILQKDFFSSILKLSNIYAVEDKWRPRHLVLTPYVDFYDLNPANAVDWTYKLNRDKAQRLKPMSELNSRYYEFNYKSDSDYWNDLYKKRYNETYGSRIYDSQFEFANEKSELPIIFSGTPLVGYQGEDKVYSTIYKKSGNTEEQTDSNIRILQTKKVAGVVGWNILADDGSTLGSYTDYGYAGHLDDPDAPSNDLNFGAPKELFFTVVSGNISVNQFNLYYSSYMAEITDKDSRLFTGSFYLTTKDIANLDFSKLVMIDGALFRLNKISDYNASNPDDCKVELLRVAELLY